MLSMKNFLHQIVQKRKKNLKGNIFWKNEKLEEKDISLGDPLFREEEVGIDDILKSYTIGKDQELLFQGKTVSEILGVFGEES